MNIKIEEDMAATEYAAKNGCTVAAARMHLGQKMGEPKEIEQPRSLSETVKLKDGSILTTTVIEVPEGWDEPKKETPDV